MSLIEIILLDPKTKSLSKLREGWGRVVSIMPPSTNSYLLKASGHSLDLDYLGNFDVVFPEEVWGAKGQWSTILQPR